MVRKRSGRKQLAETAVSPFPVQRGISGIFFPMAKKTPDVFDLGGIFVDCFFENHGVF
jgi:hypothetical protein